MADTNAALLLPAPNTAAGTNSETIALRDIKGPVYVANSWTWLAWSLLALALGFAAWRLWRRYRLKKGVAKPAVVIPPHRRAKDRLRSAAELMSDPYAFCSLVSDVLRAYVEERFDLHAPDRTTEEFLGELRYATTLRADHKGLLEDFLTRCDLVKFARHEPTQPELQALLDAAFKFIDETAPTAGPAETPPAEAKQAA